MRQLYASAGSRVRLVRAADRIPPRCSGALGGCARGSRVIALWPPSALAPALARADTLARLTAPDPGRPRCAGRTTDAAPLLRGASDVDRRLRAPAIHTHEIVAVRRCPDSRRMAVRCVRSLAQPHWRFNPRPHGLRRPELASLPCGLARRACGPGCERSPAPGGVCLFWIPGAAGEVC